LSDPVVTEEEVLFPGTPEKETDYRYYIAIVATVGYLVMLTLAIILEANAGGVLSLFDKVAAAISGPMGAIWGYYFGVKRKETPE
jgi:hypothetical protein